MKFYDEDGTLLIDCDTIEPNILEYLRGPKGWTAIINDVTSNETINNVWEITFDSEWEFRKFIEKYNLEVM